jgi:hypothetical protein
MSTIRTRLTSTNARHPLHAAYRRRLERAAVRTGDPGHGRTRPAPSADPVPLVLLSTR